LDDLHFKCIFHKHAGSGFEPGSEIKVKVGSGSEKNNFGSTTPSLMVLGLLVINVYDADEGVHHILKVRDGIDPIRDDLGRIIIPLPDVTKISSSMRILI
jgi:hypothetical protein